MRTGFYSEAYQCTVHTKALIVIIHFNTVLIKYLYI